jgi:hypothetical protein
LLFFNFSVRADIKINEFLIEPDPQTVELINIGTESLDISNWYIDDSGGTTYFTIPENTIIFPNYCLVFSSNLNLNKSSADTVRLFNNTAPPTSQSATLIDSYSYAKSPGIGISFSRIPDGSGDMSTSSASLGLYNETGLNCIKIPDPTPTTIINPTNTPIPTLAQTIIQTLTPTPTSAPLIENVYISEAMVSPDNENEWVELYNNNDFDIELNNWYIDDIENAGSSPKKFTKKILAKNYEIIEFTSSMFNNSGDTIRLLDESNNLKDSFTYSFSEKGKTFGRINFDDNIFCLQNPSKGLQNTVCIYEEVDKQDSQGNENINNNIISSDVKNQTIKPQAPKDYLIKNPQNYSLNINKPEVLGTVTELKFSNSNNKPIIKSFSITSFLYSLLTLLSISLKIKFEV